MSAPSAEAHPRRSDVRALPVPLSRLTPGQGGTITHIDHQHRGTARKLLALGLLPGVSVRLQQAHPAFVLRIGRTQLALDASLAEAVRVRLG